MYSKTRVGLRMPSFRENPSIGGRPDGRIVKSVLVKQHDHTILGLPMSVVKGLVDWLETPCGYILHWVAVFWFLQPNTAVLSLVLLDIMQLFQPTRTSITKRFAGLAPDCRPRGFSRHGLYTTEHLYYYTTMLILCGHETELTSGHLQGHMT